MNEEPMTAGTNVPENASPNVLFDNIARQIIIEPLHYGYRVSVGCQQFAIETKEKLLNNLVEYLADPQTKARKWIETKTLS